MHPEDYRICDDTLDADHALRDIGRQVLLVPSLHPVNMAEEKALFFKRHARGSPQFVYRQLSYDPLELRARLKDVHRKAGRIRSPWLRSVYRAKCRELDLKLALLAARGTAEFLPLSMKLYLRPTRRMVHDAVVLTSLPRMEEEKHLSAARVEKALRATTAAYRRQNRSFRCRVKWVDSSLADASVGDAQLNIRTEPGYSDRFLLVLQHHEIGVHLVTAQNGDRQRLNIFRGGLAGYDQTQEGLALLSEFRSGAITTSRLRVLGARVLAIDLLCRGASFGEVFAAITSGLGFSAEDAFPICIRCFRGGGYTKDVIYQPGFLEVFNYWLRGGDLHFLFLGKFPLAEVKHVKESMRHGLVKMPVFVPPLVQDEGRLHAERTVFSLLRRGGGRLTAVAQLAKEEVRAEKKELEEGISNKLLE
ncbi:MAG TPA: tyrosine/phenylalanine carboxypeptidase domain-containing protein [Planctomycetota bacterium]|nr:tyrosine/phenylalanine carboxypeptidase domain-containing protein [Planctomycetota bacterium]